MDISVVDWRVGGLAYNILGLGELSGSVKVDPGRATPNGMGLFSLVNWGPGRKEKSLKLSQEMGCKGQCKNFALGLD